MRKNEFGIFKLCELFIREDEHIVAKLKILEQNMEHSERYKLDKAGFENNVAGQCNRWK